MTRSSTRRTFAGLAIGVPGLAALYACTPGEPPPADPPATNAAITQRQTGGGAQETEVADAGAGGGGTSQVVTMHDLYFDPAEFTIPADTDFTVSVINEGALNHYWEVTDYPALASPEVPGGDTTQHDVIVNLPEGTYDFICPVPGHASAGMVGVLTVSAAAGGAQSDEGAGAAEQMAFNVSMVDLAFEPADLTIPANTDVTVNVVNNGNLPHYWAVVDQNIASPETQGGDTTAHPVTVNLPPGTYEVICPVPGHAAAGMVGTLTVSEDAGGTESAPESGTPEVEGAPDGGTPETQGTPEGGTPEAEGTPAGDGAAASGQTAFNVSMVDLAFEPANFTIPANTDVTVTVVNNGNLPHYWALADRPEIASPETPGGDTTPHNVTVNLPAGAYDVLCPVPGHAAAGMVGVLTVQ
ncbi:MAG TPA: cupredoxin domain-containing protein [Thermomicrobiales bacterium]|jgi:uncharacterized cupredoxin-like copper-binding protein|nr:cupredoxin domain-containing protein [Thermomicrobiales bacterium]